MIRRATTTLGFTLAMLLLATAATPSAASDLWLHIRVEESGHGGEKVNVNVPFQLIESLVPLIETREFHGGKLDFRHAEIDGIDLRAVLSALREAPDAEFVTVRSDDELVRVSKEEGFIKVDVEDKWDSERVRVRMPMAVIEALVGNNENELDVMAALRALGAYTHGDIVTVESGDESVRIWIDDRQEGE